jgi:putative ABC transport system permease protein
MTALWHDLRTAARVFRKRPGFTAVVVATLALGIGITTAVFSLIHGVLLRPFPYREPDRLVRVETLHLDKPDAKRGCSLLDIEDYRRMSRTLVDVGAYTTFDSDVRTDGPSEAIKMTQMHPAALATLGVSPVLGRVLLPEEDVPGGDVHKAVISHRLWRSRFGGDRDVVGQTLRTSIRSFEIVGVMPPGFAFPERTDVWTTMESWYAMAVGEARVKRRDSRFYATIARLAPGVTVEQAQADLDRVAVELEARHPVENQGIRTRLTPLREFEVRAFEPYLALLFGAVLFVLLICCANVANLMLTSATGRSREFAIRAALGATRARQARALLTESLLLALLGGAVGAVLAHAAVNALLLLIPDRLPFWMRIEVDTPVLLFSLSVAIATSLVFGGAPALLASRVDLQATLAEGARGSGARSRLRTALIVAEVTLCLVLLVGAGLMMRSFIRLQHVDPGFDSQSLLVARVTTFTPGTRAEKAAELSQRHERMLARLRQLPGVASAAATNSLPFAAVEQERSKTELRVKGRADQELAHTVPLEGADVSAGYFATMGIPLVRGRLFDTRDTTSSQMTVIVSQRAAETLWPGRDPIGQEVLWGPLMAGENPYCTVVGVVGNVKHGSAETDTGVELYYPYTQYPITNVYYVIRTRGDPTALAPAVRRAIGDTDQSAAIVFLRPMTDLVDESMWQRRLWGVMFGVFAALALVLAAIGIYGVLSYSVSQRTRELGVRLALGAQPGDLLRMVTLQGMRMVLVGLVLGLGAAFALARLARSLLFGVAGHDPATFIVVCLALIGVGLLACYLPARRAARLDPVEALRVE